MMTHTLPIPDFFDPQALSTFYRVDYATLSDVARRYAAEYQVLPACEDAQKIGLLLVDVQNTFCLPDFELFVGGRTGMAAVEDNRRLCEFIYRHLNRISHMMLTMDTHMAMSIFHQAYLVDDAGHHPEVYSQITVDDIDSGRWRFNTRLAETLGMSADKAQKNLDHYVRALARHGKYQLTIWPYHAMLGGIGHAIVSGIEEAVFFHSQVRYSQPAHSMKGLNPHTENYSVLGPDVMLDASGEVLVPKNHALMEKLIAVDKLIIAGQAKSHCVAWTVDDLLTHIQQRDPALAKKIYLLEDCTTPIVISGGVDYTDYANKAFARFADAGMNIIRSTDPLPF